MQEPPARPVLHTIGYQGATPEVFLAQLRRHGVTLLVDVRNAARSRKAGFAKGRLSAALEEAGVSYEHWKALGAPAALRRALAASGDRGAFLADYEALLVEREDVLERLAARLEGEVGCLMCFEREAEACHRARVAARLVERGLVARGRDLDGAADA